MCVSVCVCMHACVGRCRLVGAFGCVKMPHHFMVPIGFCLDWRTAEENEEAIYWSQARPEHEG